jgi:hypothetical protein
MRVIKGNAVEALTTIGWLMWHIGSMPERLWNMLECRAPG